MYSDIVRRLSAVRRSFLGIELRSNLLRGTALLAALIAVLVLGEELFRFNSSLRTIFFIAGIFTLLVGGFWFILRPTLKFLGLLAVPTDFDLAALVGRVFPEINDRLLNLLQLHDDRNRGTFYSEELIDASFQDLATATMNLNFIEAIDISPVRRSASLAGISLGFLAFLIALAPVSSLEACYRLLHFEKDFVPPAAYSLNVRPGNTEIVKGESVAVSVAVVPVGGQEIPVQPLSLFWKPDGQNNFETLKLKPDSLGQFGTTLSGLRASTLYYAEFASVPSERFRITVVDRPIIRSLRVRLDFPTYTKLPSRFQDNFVGDISALAGTRVIISGTANKELQSASLQFTGKGSRSLAITGDRFSGQFLLEEDSEYSLDLVDRAGLHNADPISYKISLVPDAYPTVEILEPGKNVDVAGLTTLPLSIQIRDDFGFSHLRLGSRLIHSRYEPPSEQYRFTDIPLPKPASPQAEVPFVWDFSGLKLVPEDIVEYFAEVFDNDDVRGPKSTRSHMFQLRLPSLEEVFTDLDRDHEETLEDLRKTAADTHELKKRIESIHEDFKKNKEFDWQQQKNLEETARKYQDLQKKLDDVQQRLERMTEQMRTQGVLSPETMEKYLELQQLFEQLNSAELQQAMKQLQQALQNANKDQLQRALERLTFSEEQFRQSLERTLDLLKRIQIEQKLDEVRKRAEELTELQKDLAKATEKAGNDTTRAADLARKQADALEKFNRMTESARDLQNRMEEFFTEMPEEELQTALQMLDSSAVSRRMEAAAEQIQSSAFDQAHQTQAQITGALQQFSQEISGMQMQMLREQQQFVFNELRKATKNLLELSAREETLKNQSQTAPQNSPRLRENAQDQMRLLQDLQNVVTSLQSLSRRSFAVTPEMAKAIGDALTRIQNSLKALEIRSGVSASQEQREAMEALNKAAMAVQQSMQDMMEPGGQGGGGLLGQLRQMAGRQMSLNMRTQGVEDAARLAAEQEAIRKSLEQLNAEARASGDRQRILGDLEHIAKEMQEVVRDLEQGDANPETINKQERILSRLLDASRSTQERDFEKKRRAQTGKQFNQPSPPGLDASTLEGRTKLRQDLLRALEHGYSKDYQELIRRYFEQLEKEVR